MPCSRVRPCCSAPSAPAPATGACTGCTSRRATPVVAAARDQRTCGCRRAPSLACRCWTTVSSTTRLGPEAAGERRATPALAGCLRCDDAVGQHADALDLGLELVALLEELAEGGA